MNGGTIIILALWIFGICKGWKEISQGTGTFGSRFSEETRQSLNSSEGTIKKLLLCVLLGYVVMGVTFIKVIARIVLWIVHGGFL